MIGVVSRGRPDKGREVRKWLPTIDSPSQTYPHPFPVLEWCRPPPTHSSPTHSHRDTPTHAPTATPPTHEHTPPIPPTHTRTHAHTHTHTHTNAHTHTHTHTYTH